MVCIMNKIKGWLSKKLVLYLFIHKKGLSVYHSLKYNKIKHLWGMFGHFIKLMLEMSLFHAIIAISMINQICIFTLCMFTKIVNSLPLIIIICNLYFENCFKKSCRYRGTKIDNGCERERVSYLQGSTLVGGPHSSWKPHNSENMGNTNYI